MGDITALLLATNGRNDTKSAYMPDLSLNTISPFRQYGFGKFGVVGSEMWQNFGHIPVARHVGNSVEATAKAPKTYSSTRQILLGSQILTIPRQITTLIIWMGGKNDAHVANKPDLSRPRTSSASETLVARSRNSSRPEAIRSICDRESQFLTNSGEIAYLLILRIG